MAKLPGFLKDLGIQGNPANQKAFDLLDSIIGAGGSTRGLAGRMNKFAGRPGGNRVRRNIAGQESLVSQRRRLTDFGLVDMMLNKPALQARNLQLQKLRNQVAREGGRYQDRQSFFKGLGQVAFKIAAAFDAASEGEE